MIHKLHKHPRLPARVLRKIKKLNPLTGGEWDLSIQEVKDFKSILKAQLKKIQNNKCAYCGLTMGETSRFEIEHIAPKGGKKRPAYTMYTFTPINLVLACNLCNSPEKKGQYNTISNNPIAPYYTLNTFKIVHPYLDDHAVHYGWAGSLIRALTPQAIESIRIFQLDSTAHTEAREKLNISEKMKAMKNDPAMAAIYDAIIAYKP